MSSFLFFLQGVKTEWATVSFQRLSVTENTCKKPLKHTGKLKG